MLAGYYQKNKGKLPKKACERYQNFSEEEKDKKRKYGCKQNRNFSKKERNKNTLVVNDIEIFQKMKNKG